MNIFTINIDNDSPYTGNRLINTIEQVATIEEQLYGKQAWTKQTIETLLKQKQNGLLIYANEQDRQQKVYAYCLYQALYENAEILRIGTCISMQRQGIARKIINHLLLMLKQQGVEHILLEVKANNIPAINLYEQLGFQQIDIRKGYYKLDNGNTVNAIIMQKEIK